MKERVDAVCCEFKYSGAADSLLAAAALGTLALAAAMPLGAALQAPLALCVAALALRARRSIAGVRTLHLGGDGVVVIESRDGSRRTGAVRDGSFVAPWLTIVRWRPNAGRFDRTVLILPGMLRPEAHRMLRVLLRWG
jgi:hypothetical protein